MELDGRPDATLLDLESGVASVLKAGEKTNFADVETALRAQSAHTWLIAFERPKCISDAPDTLARDPVTKEPRPYILQCASTHPKRSKATRTPYAHLRKLYGSEGYVGNTKRLAQAGRVYETDETSKFIVRLRDSGACDVVKQ